MFCPFHEPLENNIVHTVIMGVAKEASSVNGFGSAFAAKHNLPSHFIGGSRLDLAPPGKVKDFVAKNDGHSVITSVR